MNATANYDVIVLGGGAAGLMCAAVAAARGRRTVVLEGSKRCGKKILMSGGGRCNFTNVYSTPENFLSANPHFCKSALARYTPADFIALVDAHDIAYHEKEKGQLFCNESSRQIVTMLLDECAAAGAQIHVRAAVEAVEHDADAYVVETDKGRFRGQSLVVATGGLSIPKMGASGVGYRIARQFGLPVRETRAALVPFTFAEGRQAAFGALSGVGLDVEAGCNDALFEAGMLFTHRGLSGPAMLQVSSYWQPGDSVEVDWFAGADIKTWLGERRSARPDARLATILAQRLPRRLAQCLCNELGADGLGNPRLRQLDDSACTTLADRLSAWRFVPDGTEGYRTAEVTIGGVDTDALSSATMAARDVPGLYFIGEVVDVTGHLGGHNFQWAWASAQAAGAAV
ncbi:NAD(P)/FAD-dependent oxidoreductase [Salinisphaera sp.]|uniref:NAD(P)/FAD-dependent oxidoreductase n=1 Tax=Salinisphaera sp. TaxID=1914330 RepID=UPI000C469CDF|nr:NAD(P)/FAD-dependent oxidoreductase [Salinisphaera sp.]MAS11615.1 aminoacetone oxidase family FAD-binding enzyme [Salinisphaera sp.]